MVYVSAIKHATKNDNERAKTDEREKKRDRERERIKGADCSPLLDSTSMVMHSAGRVSNSMKIVVKAGSITKGTKKRKAKRLKVLRRMKNAVV